MVRNVLVVDDDQEMLLSLKEGLQKYSDTFSVLMAGDGLVALEKLKENTVSLVVTDLKMPRMDGFALLSQIMQHYPDIPVIIITGYSTPKMEKLARDGGAVGYIEKPFMIDDLARKIMTVLRKESNGGTLHGVSSGIFLQLVEMEQKTCTIRVFENETGKQGVLFFREGDLIDARSNSLQGEAAAYEIFSWDHVTLSIQNDCSRREKKIQSELQAILLEAMRLKDEAATKEDGAAGAREEEEAEKPTPVNDIQIRLERELGKRSGLQDIYQDSSWDGLVIQASRLGEFFDVGKLKLGYLDRGESSDFVLLPESPTLVISVSPKAPRDRIIEVLSA
jgi:DNA-binding response OmpR family regulator